MLSKKKKADVPSLPLSMKSSTHCIILWSMSPSSLLEITEIKGQKDTLSYFNDVTNNTNDNYKKSNNIYDNSGNTTGKNNNIISAIMMMMKR